MKHAVASLRFSLSEDAPYYQQLIEQIQHGIASGQLSVNDKLPSSRTLALSLGVSRSTTSRAYEQLIAEGILVSEQKRGVFVAATTISSIAEQSVRATSPIEVEKMANEEKTVEQAWLAFDSGADVSVFPCKEWAASMRRSWLKPDWRVLNGDYESGLPALKEAIRDYLYQVRGLLCDGEQVFLTAGNRDALLQLQHVFVSVAKKAKWWVEDPTYLPIIETLSQQGNVGLLPMDDDGACLQTADNSSFSPDNIAVLTPGRQYPLGITMSSPRRQEWIQRLQDPSSSWWLVEDDYDNEFVYQGRSNVPLMQTASLHEVAKDRLFFIGSFSKVLFRGLRLGFIIAPLKHAKQLARSQKLLGSSVSLPIQPAVADFMIQGNFGRHMNRMRRYYRLKRDALLALLEACLVPWFVWQRPSGGMHVLIELAPCWFDELRGPVETMEADKSKGLKPPLWDEVIAARMKEQGLLLSTLSSHFVKKPSRQGFILGFSSTPEDVMRVLVQALAEVCRELCPRDRHIRV
ncbi:HTH-type transcriptional regulatory protein GabR [Marinomonas spartinae]|uniref:aminotransferase-like domain-containing protein n=1 Tax=Marinomonas spartinae TaxID=1792290 RepID=UPI0008090136|nr:PLP-dependent aminotransferase family protein [Marinomonas spartinae]SBS39569.1 HTH-type transcriptional regulatory protein GabR [Marinomonas spartinae]